nr:MAG TPA: hypothetical protein [Caudoviricetes sp.]
MRGTLKYQSFPCCGEDIYILRIYIRVSPSRCHGGRRGTCLRLHGPSPFPLPDDKGSKRIVMIKFNALKE